MTLAFVAMSLVVLLCPRHMAAAEVDPKVNTRAKMFVAMAAQVDFEDLTGLKADRSGSSDALQAVRSFKCAPIAAKLA